MRRIIICLFVVLSLLIPLIDLSAQSEKNKQRYVFIPLIETLEFAMRNCDRYKEIYSEYSLATFIGDSILVSWHYLDDLPISEIAKMMGKNEETTRVLLHRALKSLRYKIEKT